LATAVALVAVLTVIVLSPLLFVVIARRTSQWPELADVGSAYGGVAAVLSGVALVGIALSLLFQWRQTVSTQILSLRQHHFELVKLGIADPRLLSHDEPADDAEATLRRLHYNLWVAQWAMLWDLRQCDESYLRQVAAELFAHRTARAWWQAHGRTWSAKPTRRRQRFYEILTSECARMNEAAPR
jgi:hypothetical protein